MKWSSREQLDALNRPRWTEGGSRSRDHHFTDYLPEESSPISHQFDKYHQIPPGDIRLLLESVLLEITRISCIILSILQNFYRQFYHNFRRILK